MLRRNAVVQPQDSTVSNNQAQYEPLGKMIKLLFHQIVYVINVSFLRLKQIQTLSAHF